MITAVAVINVLKVLIADVDSVSADNATMVSDSGGAKPRQQR